MTWSLSLGLTVTVIMTVTHGIGPRLRIRVGCLWLALSPVTACESRNQTEPGVWATACLATVTLTICLCTKWYTAISGYVMILRNPVDFQHISFFLRYIKTHPDIPLYLEISVVLLGYLIQFQISVYMMRHLVKYLVQWDIWLLPTYLISFEISQSNTRYTTVYWDICVTLTIS